jgi:hypothetical protein
MTAFTDAAGSPPIAPFRIHYLDAPSDFTSVPLTDGPGRPVTAALVTSATLVALAIVVVALVLLVSS